MLPFFCFQLLLFLRWKPTTIHTTINFLSNHSPEHNAAYRYHINRMLSLPLTEERRQTERETIQTIAQNYSFPNTHIVRLKTQLQHPQSWGSPPNPHLVQKVLEKGTATKLLTLRACVANKKGKILPIYEHSRFLAHRCVV